MAWKEKLGSKMIDLGTPLGPGLKINPDGSSEPSKKEVTGYSMILAKDIKEAKSLLENHPHLGWNPGCDIEIHQVIPL